LNGEPPFDKEAYGGRLVKDRRAQKVFQYLLERSLEPPTSDPYDALMDEGAADETLCSFYHKWKEVIDVCWEFYDHAVSEREREIAHTMLKHQQIASILAEIDHCISARHPRSYAQRIEQFAIRASLLASETVYRNYDDFANEAIRGPLNAMAQSVRTRLRNTSDKVQIVDILNQVFFREQGFSASMENDDRVEDFMSHIVLQRKRGHSATLAVLYLCIARRLDLKCDIIALPGRFFLKIRSTKFFVDVSNGGRMLRKRDLGRIYRDLEHLRIDRNRLFQRSVLDPITPEETLNLLCHGMMAGIGNAEEAGEEFNEMTSLRLLLVSFIGMMVDEPYEFNENLKSCFKALSRRWGLTFQKIRDETSSLT
jgi:regulator of sirC expression with transglutaminase-like and TPR domain